MTRLAPKTIMALLLAALVGWAGSPSAVDAQESEKRVKTTTDSRGFERVHTEVDLMYETAKQYINAKKFAEAAVELEKVMEADITRLDALHDLGQCYQKLEQYDKAAAAYKRAAEHHTDDERLLVNLGYYQMRARDIDGALTTYQRILKRNPSDFEANRWVAYIHEKKKNTEDALVHYQKAMEAKPDDVNVIGSIAKIYMEMDRTQDALAMYERAIENAPAAEVSKIKNSLGKLYIETGDFQKSARIFGDLVQDDPDSPANQYNLGVSYIQIGHAGEAIPHLEKAIGLKPDFCLAYQQLANACIEANQPQKALQTASSGLSKCSAKQAALYYQKGRALEKLTRYDEAIDSFQMATSDPVWGTAARKQIQRQEDLIKRAQAMKNR